MTTDGTDFDAATYDDRQGFVADYGRDVLDVLDPAPGERILDLGCGTGAVTADLAAAVGATGSGRGGGGDERGDAGEGSETGEVVGIDASASMIERARERHPGITFERVDATEYVAEEPFDAVFSNAALHWIDDQDAVLEGVADSLRPGGRFVAELGASGNVGEILAAVRAEGRERGVDVATPWHFPTLGAYATRLEAHGFTVRLARTFVRETTLDGSDGLGSWLGQFGDELLGPFDGEARGEVVAAVEDRLREDCYDSSRERWSVDYRRLQFRVVLGVDGDSA